MSLYQRLRRFVPQTPLLVIVTYIMRVMHFIFLNVTCRLLDNSSFRLARSTFLNVLTPIKSTYLSVHKLLGRSVFKGGGHCAMAPLLTLSFSNKINGA